MPTSPNSLMMTAVWPKAGSARRRRSNVVLPEPRNPVSSVTGGKAGISSAIIDAETRQHVGGERVAEPPGQFFRRRPEMSEILDDLALAGQRRQQEGRAL